MSKVKSGKRIRPKPCEHGLRAETTCGKCNRKWCGDCDPAPSALCHWCHGRGYSTAPIARKRKKKPRPAASVGVCCIREWAKTGDVTSLMAGADWEIEHGMEPLIGRVLEMGDSAVHFFYQHGGGVTCAGEPQEMTTLRTAINLTMAELWAAANRVWAEWVDDDDYDPENYDSPDMPEFAFGCVIRQRNGDIRMPMNPVLASLWGITFEGDGLPYDVHANGGYPPAEAWPDAKRDLKPYARVVCAELCLELAEDAGIIILERPR